MSGIFGSTGLIKQDVTGFDKTKHEYFMDASRDIF